MKTILILAALLCAPASGSDFPSWMAGSWGGTIDGVQMEEHWSNADGKLMIGMHRDVNRDGKASFEFLRIALVEGRITYLAMPSGRPATPFPLKASSESRVVFENPEHDFPQRIIYWRDGRQLCARVEGMINGKAAAEEWCWNRR